MAIKKAPVKKAPAKAAVIEDVEPLLDAVPEIQEKLYVRKATQVDTFNTHVEHVPLEEDMCPICGFSVCEVNKLPRYADLDEAQRMRVDGTLESHRAKHIPGERPTTVRESELVKEWVTKKKVRRA